MDGSKPGVVPAAAPQLRPEKFRAFTPEGLALVFLFAMFAALIIARRPDCLTHSQFWAEDGKRFFADAMERPAWLNLVSYGYGYFDLVLRLMHQTAALFPLAQGPRVVAIYAISMQAAVPTFLVSARSEQWLGPFPIRLAVASLYCAMPNSFEVHAIALHSRVHLAVLAALIIVSTRAVTRTGKIFDMATLVLSGLSGPFIFVLVPAAFWRYAATPSPALKRHCVVLLAILPIGFFALLSSSSRRGAGQMDASVQNGVRILGGQFTSSFFLGEGTYAHMLTQPWFNSATWAGFVVLVTLLAVILRYTSNANRCLLLLGFGLLAMALKTPLAGPDRSPWETLWMVPGCGQRYYLPAMAALLFGLGALAGRGLYRWQRTFGLGLLLIVAAMGARVDFFLSPFTNYHFGNYAKIYRALPEGASLAIPINPPGWIMNLRKPSPPP